MSITDPRGTDGAFFPRWSALSLGEAGRVEGEVRGVEDRDPIGL